MTNDIVIRAAALRKVYRLYASPGYRFLDMFGLLGDRPGAYTEHAALNGIDLTIRRGEKVAFIGRNGAGKSTLLKLLTRVIEPTSGTLDVSGKAHALLQIGSGFHPDFTGRENVYAYLAQLGVSGAEADRRYAEIVDFAELEEYIGQPVKTYSSGMAVRLMFATSTAITPDLLVLDEVLGVGDAYFAHKSYNRIRDLCAGQGTTLLLVTHDVYSAVNICERVIWIDRGRILMDGEGPAVVNAYEDSIRVQEEHRLRLKAQSLQRQAIQEDATTRVLVEIRSLGNEPQPAPVYFSAIELLADGQVVDALSFSGPTPTAWMQEEGAAWGPPTSWHGEAAQALLNYGSPYHKVAAVFHVPRPASTLGGLTVRARYWSEVPCRLTAHLFVGQDERMLGELPPSDGGWVTHTASHGADHSVAAAVNASGRQGTGDILVTSVMTHNWIGEPAQVFKHGEPFALHVDYRIHAPQLSERVQVLVAFHRDGVQDVCRIWTQDLLFDRATQPSGTVKMELPSLYLGNGNYTVTVMMVRSGYFDREQTVFYSINPGMYCSVSRALEITVQGGGVIATGTAVVGQASWTLLDRN